MSCFADDKLSNPEKVAEALIFPIYQMEMILTNLTEVLLEWKY